eukprot:4374517-Amphidinium_carterae.1
MSIDGDRAYPQGNPTPPESSTGLGTTIVGMGPIGTGIGTQCSVASDIPAANPHIYPPSSITAPTVPAIATQQQLTPVPSDHPDV